MTWRIQSIALLMFLFISQVHAEDKTLGNRFLVPKQGHVEFQHCFNCEVKGLKLENKEDVLTLHERIAKIPFNEELITSFKFLEKLGLEKLKQVPPPPRPGARGRVHHLPDWRSVTVDFDEERFVRREKASTFQFSYAKSLLSEVLLSRNPLNTQVEHFEPGGSHFHNSVVRELFSRSTIYDEVTYTTEWDRGKEVCLANVGRGTAVFYSEQDKDLIDAKTSIVGGQILDTSLHFYHRKPVVEDGIWLPRLSLRIHRKSKDTFRMSLFIIGHVELAKPVDPEALKVPIQVGAVYMWGNNNTPYLAKMPIALDDLLDKTPGVTRVLIEEATEED